MDFMNLGWFRIIREGNGKPLQCSCLENPRQDFQQAIWKETRNTVQGSLVGCCLWGHTESDTTEATSSSRIIYSSLLCLLENDFGIKPGIIFAEMPCGRQHLQNLDDAINGSAWTILLLTENFLRDTWCKFQFYSSLMNSVTDSTSTTPSSPCSPWTNPCPERGLPLCYEPSTPWRKKVMAFLPKWKGFFSKLYGKRPEIRYKGNLLPETAHTTHDRLLFCKTKDLSSLAKTSS